MNDAVSHAALRDLEFADGVLTWGGRKVTEIADAVGQTPFYAYDIRRVEARVAELRRALPDALKLHYAMKANPMPEFVRKVAPLVDGLDVASAGELTVALTTGTKPSDISFAGPGKRDAELLAALESGITVNLESEAEMRRMAALAESTGLDAHVAIRVNPAFELKTSGMKMGGRPSQFGVDAERVPAMLEELSALGLNFRGFHVYSGSQNLRAEAIRESLEQTVNLIIELAAPLDRALDFVNLGGGLGIPYFPNEAPLDLDDVGSAAADALATLSARLDVHDVVMELGRFLVGEAGIYVTKVIDVKESRGQRFAICDGGLHHHLAASGNFGQVLRKNYPVVAVTETAATETVSVVGPLCTPLDLLADRMELSALAPDSLVAVLQSGAYGISASPTAFLSHPSCAEIVV